MRLPAALSPWGPYLQLFEPLSDEMAGALWPLVQRLDALLGALGRSDRHGDGEPDGYSGIDRRGSYERLLMTEWLLADEMPEEFARRSVMGEHAFYQIARRSEQGGRRSIALFDAGPNQWGTPRVAQLAALVVLERRARAAGAGFLWGVLQQSPQPLDTVSASTALNLMESRSLREVGTADLDAWKQHLELEPPDELWLVGGRRLARLDGVRGVSLLQVRDPLDPQVRQLEVRAVTPARSPAEVVLPLPDESMCVRLLRDPFEARSRPADPTYRKGAERYIPASQLVWSIGGNKLLALGAEGGVIAFPVPNSPAAGTGQPRLFRVRSGNPVYAAGRIGRTLMAVTAPGPNSPMRLEALGNRDHRFPDNGIEMSVLSAGSSPDNKSLFPLGLVLPIGNATSNLRDVAVLVQGSACLVRVEDRTTTMVIQEPVSAMAPVASGIIFAQDDGKIGRFDSRGEVAWHPGFSRKVEQVLFGYGAEGAGRQWGLFAAHVHDSMNGIRRWELYNVSGATTLFCPERDQVVGVIARPIVAEGPGLVVLHEDRRHISVMAAGWSHTLPEAASEIEQVVVSPIAPWIAYLTKDREVCVYSLHHETMLYRFSALEEAG